MLTDQKIENIRRLKENGASLRALCAEFKMSDFEMRSIINPAWREMRRAQVRAARQRRGQGGISRHPEQGRVSRDEFLQRSATIPRDTRDLTARLFGDPLPGRSALDQMQEMPR